MDPDDLQVILLTNFNFALFNSVGLSVCCRRHSPCWLMVGRSWLSRRACQHAPPSDLPSQFVLYHYNGLPRAGAACTYARGSVRLNAPSDFGASPVDRALRTKWPTLDTTWEGDAPSIQ